MSEMTQELTYEMRAALAAGRALPVSGESAHHEEASPEAEAALSELLGVTIGMFVLSMATVVAVGIWLF